MTSQIAEHLLSLTAVVRRTGTERLQPVWSCSSPLAKALEAHECWVGATAVYRALLDAILQRAYARAYGHAYRYWLRLEAIAAIGADLGRLGMHESYMADLRLKHAQGEFLGVREGYA